ncbi:MAG TPA: hypothetical protein DEH25_11780 [Chloroflexi bacterium]|nr:hypothetical protein [Chloroflexota bacterium]
MTAFDNSPLARYLPPIPQGMAATWIESRSLKGKFLLDPFAASADLIVEAARSGSSIIVAANNPIARLLIEISASPPTTTEAHQVLSALAATRIRDERLELHIRALYDSTCPNCQAQIQIQAFLWEREASHPFARLLHCPHCGESGEFPATESDRQNASRFSTGGLHYARALERVASINDPDRSHVEEALNVYPPRAVYALLTIINKLDALNISPREEKILAALLLHTFDRGNTLWAYPVARERPRQLTVPPVYGENNLWLALENAADAWSAPSPALQITHWPELPSSEGGICLFEGRIRDLAGQIEKTDLAGILMAFPRPNQAYWALSALWAGWLWGHTAVEHFKSVLRRRRFDWGWHTTALQAALENLPPTLPNGLPILGLVGEAEPGFIGAALIAATKAGFYLENIELRSDEKLAQIHWQIGQLPTPSGTDNLTISEAIQSVARTYLLERGEPCGYLQLHTAILSALALQNLFQLAETPLDCYNQTQQAIQAVLNFRHGFLRFGGSEKSIEVGQWWLSETDTASTPLADRVEIAVARHLIHNPGCSLEEVESAVCGEFPGLLRPSKDVILECLESYGEKSEAGWQLREVDAPSKRRAELASMVKLISGLGENLGFSIHLPESDSDPCLWLKDELPRYAFYVSASAVLGKFLIEHPSPPATCLIVIPGGRANLVMFKLQHDPYLRQIADEGWQFVKYRHIRQLADSSILSADSLDAQLELDPLTYAETQLRMF